MLSKFLKDRWKMKTELVLKHLNCEQWRAEKYIGNVWVNGPLLCKWAWNFIQLFGLKGQQYKSKRMWQEIIIKTGSIKTIWDFLKGKHGRFVSYSLFYMFRVIILKLLECFSVMKCHSNKYNFVNPNDYIIRRFHCTHKRPSVFLNSLNTLTFEVHLIYNKLSKHVWQWTMSTISQKEKVLPKRKCQKLGNVHTWH